MAHAPTSPAAPPEIIDRRRWRRRRARALKTRKAADFLHQRAMLDIVDRLETTMRDFERACFYGAGDMAHCLTPACGVNAAIHLDIAPSDDGRSDLIGDEEAWPFAPASFDLIVSLLTLHHANDLVGALAQFRASLKPDGLFIGALFGEETLSRARHALYAAELAHKDGAAARVAPFASVRDLGGALQRAGFALPVADLDHVTIAYRDPAGLLKDARALGETACLKSPGPFLPRMALFQAASSLTARQDHDGEPPIAVDIVYLTGWAPAPSQPKALKPGAAKRSLEQALKDLS